MLKFIKNTIIGINIIFFTISSCGTKKMNNANKKTKKAINKMVINEINYKGSIDLDTAEKLLENSTDIQTISTLNWSEYSYKPDVKFRIAYCQDQIWLKYYVTEENILAKETKINGNVYKDSCVEFFISPDQNDTYYNFEFNCIGTPHVGYGQKGVSKSLIAPEIVKLIKVKSSLGNQPFEEKTGGYQWEMMIIIPKECLANDKDIVLKGLKANANFYKCGDDTSKPHFVTWNPVGTENPDYHQPAFFGEVFFK